MANTNTTSIHRPQHTYLTWMPVLLGLAVIAGESTKTMGAHTTDGWLLSVINVFHSATYSPAIEFINQTIRKTGHFFGYGMLGVIFARAWYPMLHRRMTAANWVQVRRYAAAAGVASVFLIASADEFHQSFLPGRGASFHDVCIDTTGAILLNLLYFYFKARQRRHMVGIRMDERMRAHFATRMARIAMHRVRTGRSPISYTTTNDRAV